MKPSNYIKQRGMLNILEDCSMNLKIVRQHLLRECELDKKYDLSKVLKQFQKIIETTNKNLKSHTLIQEILIKLKGE